MKNTASNTPIAMPATVTKTHYHTLHHGSNITAMCDFLVLANSVIDGVGKYQEADMLAATTSLATTVLADVRKHRVSILEH